MLIAQVPIYAKPEAAVPYYTYALGLDQIATQQLMKLYLYVGVGLKSMEWTYTLINSGFNVMILYYVSQQIHKYIYIMYKYVCTYVCVCVRTYVCMCMIKHMCTQIINKRAPKVV